MGRSWLIALALAACAAPRERTAVVFEVARTFGGTTGHGRAWLVEDGGPPLRDPDAVRRVAAARAWLELAPQLSQDDRYAALAEGIAELGTAYARRGRRTIIDDTSLAVKRAELGAKEGDFGVAYELLREALEGRIEIYRRLSDGGIE